MNAEQLEKWIEQSKFVALIASQLSKDSTECVAVRDVEDLFAGKVLVPVDAIERIRNIFPGCSDHGCAFRKHRGGMGTNGGCRCVLNASRTQLHILAGALYALLAESQEPKQ